MRRRLAALFVLLVSANAAAREADARVVVRFASGIAAAEAKRLASAMRAQLPETATLVLDEGGRGQAGTFFVDVDRVRGGIELRFRDRTGHGVGGPRMVARGGEIGASEAATILRAFVLGVTDGVAAERANEVEPSPRAPSAADATGTPSEPPSARPAEDKPAATAPPSIPTQRSSVENDAAQGDAPIAPWRGRLGALYTGTTYGAGLTWQSGARAEAAFAFVSWIYAGVGYAFHPARQVANDEASVRVGRHSAAVFLGLEHMGRAFGVGVDVGAGVDISSRTTDRTATGIASTSDATQVCPTFALRLHGRWRIPEFRSLALDLAPALELAPAERSLIVEGPVTTTLLDPARARFRLDLGGTFDAF
jgi:hypothetical protein